MKKLFIAMMTILTLSFVTPQTASAMNSIMLRLTCKYPGQKTKVCYVEFIACADDTYLMCVMMDGVVNTFWIDGADIYGDHFDCYDAIVGGV